VTRIMQSRSVSPSSVPTPVPQQQRTLGGAGVFQGAGQGRDSRALRFRTPAGVASVLCLLCPQPQHGTQELLADVCQVTTQWNEPRRLQFRKECAEAMGLGPGGDCRLSGCVPMLGTLRLLSNPWGWLRLGQGITPDSWEYVQVL
jgi:hypothetical protein